MKIVEIEFDFPKGVTNESITGIPDNRWKNKWGYKHMITFWWKNVFEHPQIQKLDFYCRLDTDSYIESR